MICGFSSRNEGKIGEDISTQTFMLHMNEDEFFFG